MLLPDDLIPICKDAGDSEWRYSPSEDKYYRVYEERKEFTRISGKNLPDPEVILQNRIKTAERKNGHVDIEKLKTTTAVQALWNHHKEVSA